MDRRGSRDSLHLNRSAKLTTTSPSRYRFAYGEPGELPKLRGEGCFRPVFELRRLSAEAALVDSSGARDHHACCAWLRAPGRRSSSRRYPRQLFCVGLVGFPVSARGTAARMNPFQLESARLGAFPATGRVRKYRERAPIAARSNYDSTPRRGLGSGSACSTE